MMQKGKRIPEYEAINKNLQGHRKTRSPKKLHFPQQQHSIQYQLQLSHAKKLKITNVPKNEFNQNNIEKDSKGVKQIHNEERSQEIKLQLEGSGGKEEPKRQNMYYEAYKADLKYYNEYLEACQKMTQNGINYKWPYCFYGSN